jgi:hypothetical protein
LWVSHPFRRFTHFEDYHAFSLPVLLAILDLALLPLGPWFSNQLRRWAMLGCAWALVPLRSFFVFFTKASFC